VVLVLKRTKFQQKEETANPLYIKDLAVFFGDPSEIRTPDTLIKSQVCDKPEMAILLEKCRFCDTLLIHFFTVTHRF